MIYTLENDVAIIQIDTFAAEIASFKRKDKDIEYMWNGDKKYWANRNPLLFPHVSAPSNKILNFKGKDYKVNNHGFARNSDFTMIEKGDDYLLFRLVDDDNTYSQYPYHFELDVKYTLVENRIYIDYEIINKEDELYFGFGQHPAFNCPIDPSKSFNDYFIEFDKDDVDNNRLDLSYELFERYPTYKIDDVKSRVFRLTDGTNSVIMYTQDKYKIFAIWTPMAPFVCLEPWVNTLGKNDLDTPFESRDVIRLDKDEKYQIGYSFEIV